MSRYTIFNLRTDVARKLSTSIPSASLDFYGAIDEARRMIKKRINPPEMVRTVTLEDSLYTDVQEYAVPEEMSYDDVIEIKKLQTRYGTNVDTLVDPMSVVYRKRFNARDKHYGELRNTMTINYNNGLKTASIHHPTGLKKCEMMIHNMDSLNENGIFTVSGNIGNLQVDTINRVEGNGSFSFEVNGSSTTGSIESMNMKPFDITSFLERGAIFQKFFTSMPLEITSISLSLYSSPTDYYRYTVNGPHNNSTGFLNGWNQLKLDIKPYSGNPNPANLTGIKLEITTTGNYAGECRFDELIARSGDAYEIVFESRYCIIDPISGQWIQRATKGTDELVFEDDSYEIMVLETALALEKELYSNGAAAKSDISSTKSDLDEAYKFYQMKHKSEVIEPHDSMFDFSIEADYGVYNGNYGGYSY